MRMIDSLEQKGLARRTVNPADRRENLLSITDSGGGEVLAQYREIERRLSGELLREIPKEKVACFFEVAGILSKKARE